MTAYRELGFVDVQAGRRQTAEAWLAKAEALAGTDAQIGAVLGIRGIRGMLELVRAERWMAFLPGRRRSRPSSTSAPARSTPPPSSSSTPGR